MKEIIRECMEDARTVNPESPIPARLVEHWVSEVKKSLVDYILTRVRRKQMTKQEQQDLVKELAGINERVAEIVDQVIHAFDPLRDGGIGVQQGIHLRIGSNRLDALLVKTVHAEHRQIGTVDRGKIQARAYP